MDSHGQSQPETPVGCSLYSLSTHLLESEILLTVQDQSVNYKLHVHPGNMRVRTTHGHCTKDSGFSKCEVSPRSLATTSLLCQLLDVVEVAKFPTPEIITNSLKRFPHHELVLMHAATYHLS